MDKETLFQRVHNKTRRLADGVLEMEGIYVECLQELCMEMRWPWRRKRLAFSTVAGTSTYNLHSTSVVSGITEEIEEIIRLIYVNGTDAFKVEVITDPETMEAAQAATATGEPTGYFLEPGTDATVHLDPIPAAVYTMKVLYWAIPNPADSTTTIPLLPSKYHGVLQARMEAEVWSSLPGEGVESPNYVKAVQKYQHRLENMMAKSKFSVEESRDWLVHDEAVQST
jgi:hypothetical protein